ncbi:MAG: hypothetical protein U9N34_10025 [Candidatus Cloacimonadota bacterium]|nr:hypothetical protein [Candidatus Cloacimonadota bacterium]
MKQQIKFILLLTFIIFIIIACGELVAPDFETSPSNIALEEIDNNTIKLNWTYNEAEDDSISYIISKKEGVYYWNESYDSSLVKYYYDNTPESDTLVVSYKVLAQSQTTATNTPNSEVVALFPQNTIPFDTEIEQLSEEQIKVKWDCRASGHEGFKVDKKIGEGEWQLKYRTLNPHQFQFNDDTEMFDNVTYRVYAYAGISRSERASVSIVSTMINPSDLSNEELDINRVKLNWVDNSQTEDGFSIDKRIGQLAWEVDYARVDSNSTQFIDNVSVHTASIYYRVRTYNADSFSAYSDTTKVNILFDAIGEYETEGEAQDIVIKDWIGFVADKYNGLGIYDCRNPSNLQEIEHNLIIPDRTLSVDLENNLLYVASTSDDSNQGAINIVDLTNIEEPINFISYYTEGIPYDIDVNGDHIFVADGEAGLSIYYINSSTPMYVGHLDLDGIAKKIELYEHYAFIAAGTAGLKIVDIQDMNNPVLVNTFSSNLITDLEFQDDKLLLSDADLGLIILDVIDPENPVELSTIQTGDYASSVTAIDGRAFITDKIYGLKAINIEDFNAPFITGSIDFYSLPNSIFKYGSYVFITDETGIKSFQIKL